MKIVEIKRGMTRICVLFGKYAIKIPNFLNYKMFLNGLLGNLCERDLSPLHSRLCPVIYCNRFGLLLVMPRCAENQKEFTLEEYQAFCQPDCADGMSLENTVENKASSFGVLNGKLVALDYGLIGYI